MNGYDDRRGAVEIDGEIYDLVTEKDAKDKFDRRSWQAKWVPQSTSTVPRTDTVQDGESWVITINDFTRGISGEQASVPGTLSNIGSGSTLSITPEGLSFVRQAQSVFSSATNQESLDAEIVPWNGAVFVLIGRLVWMFDHTSQTVVVDEDFGTGVLGTDMTVHNNELVVGFGGATNKIRTRNTAGTWTTATDNTYADHFGTVEDNLWRGTATNQVSNIGPTDNPLTLANWSSGIPVGNTSYGITDLNGQGERLAVSKPEGLFLGDSGAVFPNVLPQIGYAVDADNGRKTLVRGADIFYPHRNGLIRYTSGVAEEVGLENVLSTSPNGVDVTPGPRIRALCSSPNYLWASTELSGQPLVAPTGLLKTTDNGSSYTTGTVNSLSAAATALDISSLDTVANGDWILVGSDAVFAGILLEFLNTDSSSRTLTIEYWNGAWTAVPAAKVPLDLTGGSTLSAPQPRALNGSGTFSRSGMILFQNSLSGWVTTTFNSINAYWIRLSVNAALDASCLISRARVFASTVQYIFRGRARQRLDPPGPSVLWEFFNASSTTMPLALQYITGKAGFYPLFSNDMLVSCTPFQVAFFELAPAAQPPLLSINTTMRATTTRYDGGMPFVNKQWLSVIFKGLNIDSDRDWALDYRLEGETSWTALSSSITSSPTTMSLSGVTSRSIQFRVSAAVTTTWPNGILQQLTVRFRTLDTMKEEHTYLIEARDDAEAVVAPNVILTNLDTDLRASAKTIIDPARRSLTMNLVEMDVLERFVTEGNYPALAIRVKLLET